LILLLDSCVINSGEQEDEERSAAGVPKENLRQLGNSTAWLSSIATV
jgi:hypothetical protein